MAISEEMQDAAVIIPMFIKYTVEDAHTSRSRAFNAVFPGQKAEFSIDDYYLWKPIVLIRSFRLSMECL